MELIKNLKEALHWSEFSNINHFCIDFMLCMAQYIKMIQWEEKYSVGLSRIDEEHKELIRIMNAAIMAKQHNDNIDEISKLLKQLTVYALKHFSTEESYMLEFNYPEFQYHKEEHHDFSNKAIAYCNRVIDGDYHIANEILEYLKQWLVNHIQVTDKKYVECFKKNGIE